MVNYVRYKQIIDNAALHISKTPPRTIIPNEVMDEILETKDLSRGTRYSRVRDVKDVLMAKYGLFLDSQSGSGYYVVPSGEEITLPEEKVRRASLQVRKAAAECLCIRLDKIADPELRIRTIERSQRIASIAGMYELGGSSDERISIPAQ